MSMLLQRMTMVAGLGMMLIACTAVQTKKTAYDLYELRPGVKDNDSYYVAPRNYTGCSTINENPSCSAM